MTADPRNVQDRINAELAKRSMRLACTWEPGWYVTVLVNGEPMKVWATEKDS